MPASSFSSRATAASIDSPGSTKPASAETAAAEGFYALVSVNDTMLPRTLSKGTNYLLEITYDPATDVLTGKATISARATQNLSQFNLDFVGLTVESIKVGGGAAEWERNGGELTVIPHSGIPKGDSFTTIVRYEGVPEPIEDALGTSGVIPTDDGVVIVGQPRCVRNALSGSSGSSEGDSAVADRCTSP